MLQPNRADTFEVPQSVSLNRSFSLAYADGPYGMLLPSDFFNRNPGLNLGNVTVGFQPEIGSVGCPTYGGLRKFLHDTDIARGIPHRGATTTNSIVWAFHKFSKWTTDWNETYAFDHVYTYFSDSVTLIPPKDWVAGAQLALHKQYQTLFDGFVSYLFQYTTAVILWKSQSPWPSLRGFIYDWYLESTGALRGVRASLANPVAIVLDLKRFQLRIINRRVLPLSPESGARFSWIALNGTIVEEGIASLKEDHEIEAMSSELLGNSLSWPTQCSSVCFLRVETLATADIGRTWYWLSREDAIGGDILIPSYSALGQLRQTRSCRPSVRITACECEADYLNIEVHLMVPITSDSVLFYPTIEVWSGDTQLLPLFDDGDSDIVVVPGELQIRRLQTRGGLDSVVFLTMHSWNAPTVRSLEQPCSATRQTNPKNSLTHGNTERLVNLAESTV